MADVAVIWQINRIGSVGSQWAHGWLTANKIMNKVNV